MMKAWKWQLAVGLVIVFLAGVATGMFAGARHAHFVFMGRHSEQSGERMRRHLERELQLTPEQSAQLSPIVDRTAKELEVIRRETGARVAQAMQQAHQEMIPHLDADQQKRLEEMKQRHRRMLRFHGPPPPDAP